MAVNRGSERSTADSRKKTKGGQGQAVKMAIEQNANLALKAVVEMDASLKKDLKGVKGAIQSGIKNVIDNLGVLTLNENVKSDLGTLRGKISDLKDKVEQPDSIVKGELDALAAKKSELDNGAVKQIQTETNTNLEQNFKNHIQSELDRKVSAVDTAIGALGGNFTGIKSADDQKKLQGIFEYIKQQVGEIKGKEGRKGGNGKWADTGSALEGIKNAVQQYATDVFENMRESTMDDWLPKILGDSEKNDPVKQPIKRWIEKGVNGNSGHSNVSPNIAKTMRLTIKDQIKKKLVSAVYEEAKSQSSFFGKTTGNVENDLKELKTFLEEYAKKLDKQLEPSGDSSSTFVSEIVKEVEVAVKNQASGQTTDKSVLTFAVEAILVAIVAKTRRAAGEIQSLLLGTRVGDKKNGGSKTSIAKALDNALKTARELHGQLTVATETPKGLPVQPESPAQAVDKRLEAVRDMVTDEIAGTFTSKVKQPLADAVSQLPNAVDTFNTNAVGQIKEAAKKAITAAALRQSQSGQWRCGLERAEPSLDKSEGAS
ncbi:Extracellular matrix-binding ebh, putative [Babesia ovata]|uniref:Extracellular matrix-binding ebh, putative n=1 Tax=Babesia ovata TaxID=189622 RepID=A0A2H6KA58_9APIC|nr:Extracellular matrix-binding ebh, putative [Babesia ovata]GBE59881.1 Extracellular matrix-binding ebh, putative [Babesia ovata]